MINTSGLPVRWRKSSYSTNGGNCLEVGEGVNGVVPVRDSKTDGPVLTLTPNSWGSFIAATQYGGFPSN